MRIKHENLKVLRIDEVCAMTGLSRTAIYDRGSKNSKYFDPDFPKRFKIGKRSVGWDAKEIERWFELMKSRRVE